MKPATLAPAYCSLYPALCEVARENGYALCIHGTLGCDMDLLAVAWTDEAKSANELVRAIVEKLDGQMHPGGRPNGDGTFTEVDPWEPTKKPHGRLAWSICLRDFAWNGTNPFIDLSVIPPNRLDESPATTTA